MGDLSIPYNFSAQIIIMINKFWHDLLTLKTVLWILIGEGGGSEQVRPPLLSIRRLLFFCFRAWLCQTPKKSTLDKAFFPLRFILGVPNVTGTCAPKIMSQKNIDTEATSTRYDLNGCWQREIRYENFRLTIVDQMKACQVGNNGDNKTLGNRTLANFSASDQENRPNPSDIRLIDQDSLPHQRSR
jgi:hypothetical protein